MCAFTKSEVTLKTPTIRVPRPASVAAKEVIRDLAPPRVPPRSQREWHDVFRGDR